MAAAALGALVVGLAAAFVTHERRLVAIGDLHGDLGAAYRALRLGGLVDASGSWCGGDTVLVQTGDLVDRGAESKLLYELFQRLAAEAPQQGGEVHNLLGNHESMNLAGDLRYVNATDYTLFGGRTARARAFSASGALGQWLRARPAALKLGDTVFVHAGINKQWAAVGIDGINAELSRALGSSWAMQRASVLGEHGPLWYRGYHELSEPHACGLARQALDELGAARMVMGHSIQGGRMRVRCGGQLHLIDIAMSSAIYGKHVLAWECVGCLGGVRGALELEPRIVAIYDDRNVTIQGQAQPPFDANGRLQHTDLLRQRSLTSLAADVDD